MIGEGFLINLANSLGIPLGAKVKKASNPLTKEVKKEDLNPKLALISEITRDDIILTDEPLFYNTNRIRLGKELKTHLNLFVSALNSILRWVSFDLLTTGVSVYKLIYKDDRLYFEPVVADLEFYLKDGEVS